MCAMNFLQAMNFLWATMMQSEASLLIATDEPKDRRHCHTHVTSCRSPLRVSFPLTTAPSAALLLILMLGCSPWCANPSLPDLARKAITSPRLPSVHAAVSLFSSTTGASLASIDGSGLTLLRTAAASAAPRSPPPRLACCPRSSRSRTAHLAARAPVHLQRPRLEPHQPPGPLGQIRGASSVNRTRGSPSTASAWTWTRRSPRRTS